MKIIQLNVWAGRLQNQLLGFFEKEQADILCLQEAISYDKEDAAVFTTIENLQSRFNLKYSVIAPVFSFKLMNGSAKFGNCILSRFPVQKSEVIFTNLEYKENFDFNEHNSNVRNFIHIVIKIKEQEYNFLTHHGYHIPDHKNGDAETLRQMKQLGEYIDRLKGPIVLTGDFNLALHSESLNQINKRLTNLSSKYHLKTTRSTLTHKTEVCDYIFVNKEVKTKNFRVSDELISDHKALILDFDL
jgi:endonuclease/exonuclease/phosphatase family metal-dependent hydrolase